MVGGHGKQLSVECQSYIQDIFKGNSTYLGSRSVNIEFEAIVGPCWKDIIDIEENCVPTDADGIGFVNNRAHNDRVRYIPSHSWDWNSVVMGLGKYQRSLNFISLTFCTHKSFLSNYILILTSTVCSKAVPILMGAQVVYFQVVVVYFKIHVGEESILRDHPPYLAHHHYQRILLRIPPHSDDSRSRILICHTLR